MWAASVRENKKSSSTLCTQATSMEKSGTREWCSLLKNSKFLWSRSTFWGIDLVFVSQRGLSVSYLFHGRWMTRTKTVRNIAWQQICPSFIKFHTHTKYSQSHARAGWKIVLPYFTQFNENCTQKAVYFVCLFPFTVTICIFIFTLLAGTKLKFIRLTYI